MQQRLGEKLLSDGLITAEQLECALQEHEASGRFLGEVLVDMGVLREDNLARTVAGQLEVPYVDLSEIEIDPRAARLYAAPLARDKRCFPYKLSQGVLWLAMVNPLDITALEDLAFVSGCTVEPAVARESDILLAIENHSPPECAQGADKVLEDIDQALSKTQSGCRTISILSNKGGVGKTHLSINLAYYLSRAGKSVLLIDADMGNADISNKLGIFPKVTLLNLIDADTPPPGLVTPTGFGFDLIAGCTGEFRLANLSYLQRVQFIKHFVSLGQPYDFMLLDLGAGISSQVIDFGLAADNTIVLTTTRDVVSGYACAKVAFMRHVAVQRKLVDKEPSARAEKFFCPWVIVNRLAYADQGKGIFDKIATTARNHLNSQFGDFQIMPQYLGGVLYDDKAMAAAENKREPVGRALPGSKPAKGFEKIARQLAAPRTTQPKPGVLQGLARLAGILRLRPE